MRVTWRDLPAEIFEKCKLAWRHQVPAADEERRHLRELCRRMLGFENYLLSLYNEYLTAALASEDRDRALFAVKMLGMILYDDPRIISALQRLENSEDVNLQLAAQQTLGKIRRGT